MNSENKIVTIEFTVIILLWALVVIFPLFVLSDINYNWRTVQVMWVECGVIGVAFSVNRFILMPCLFFQKKYTSFIISLVLLFFLLGVFVIYFDGVNKLLNLFISNNHNPIALSPMRDVLPRTIPPPRDVKVISPQIWVIIVSAIVIALDMGLRTTVRWLLLEQKQADVEKENTKAQLLNLQSQVSPHFFMNTLNNIHALVDIDSVRAKRTIIELSSLMDYLLYDTENQEKVALQRELDFINSYINLMRIRFTEHIVIEISYDKIVPSVKIPPFLFLNFIENSFKYGIDSELESFVKIEFNFSGDTIEMRAINSNHSKSVGRDGRGVGVANSRKRMDLIYGNKYLMEIKEDDKIYQITLKIPIE